MSDRRQLTIWDELGPEPRESVKPSAWDYHWAQQVDPDADTDAEVAAIIYPETRPSNGGERRRCLGEWQANPTNAPDFLARSEPEAVVKRLRLDDNRQGWVERWLDSPVAMEPPEVASDARPKARRGREVGNPDVGERLKKWRKERGHSQTRVAAMLGITQAAISSYERGKVIPAVARAERIEALIQEAVSASQGARGGRV